MGELFILSSISSILWTRVNSIVQFQKEKEGYNKIPRVESEFTLGFERSKSVAKTLNELGPMCSTGNFIFLGLKYTTIISTASVATAYFVNLALQKYRLRS